LPRYASAAKPAIAEIRYNFTEFGPIGDHSMRCLAEGMLSAIGELKTPRICPQQAAK
jgi:hypothetical protein